MINQCFFILNSTLKASSLWALAILLLLGSCEFRSKTADAENEKLSNQKAGISNIKHAVGFDIVEYDDYKILHLFRHYNESADTLSYLLHRKNVRIDGMFNHLTHIQVPLKKIALLHTSYLPFFDMCEKIPHISAISESKYIYNKNYYSLVSEGEIPEVSYGESLDIERLLELNISTVITVGWPNTPNKSQQKLEELGIPVLIFSDWQESTLLGRAEWVKVIAALTGADELVEVRFDEIEKEYNRMKSVVKDVDHRPSIICNLPYKGSWHVPGGNSYMSNVLYDAGGAYLWHDDTGTGGIQMDFEIVYAKGLKADVWINPGVAKELKDVVENDERLMDFNPIQTGEVYNFYKRIARESANDYWESAMIKPHFVLADFIKILHPELLPEHELYYYKQLK